MGGTDNSSAFLAGAAGTSTINMEEDKEEMKKP